MMGTQRPAARRPPRFSLRLKLTLCMIGVALLIQTLLGLVVFYYQYTAVDRLFNTRIEARMDSITSRLGLEPGRIDDEELLRVVNDRPRLAMFENSSATLYSPAGEVLASTAHPPPSFDLTRIATPTPGARFVAFRASIPGVFGDRGEPTRARLGVRRLTAPDGRELVLLLAADDWNFDAVTRVMLGVFVASSGVGIVAWSVASWLIAGLAMAPLHHLRLVAGSFSPEAIERDIELQPTSTEVAALEQSLREARLKLRTALHAQDRFISSVSHELNTPIAVLLTEAQTLPPESLSPQAREFAQSVTEEMKRLGRMVGGFLTLTRVRGGHALTEVRPIAVNDAVMETVQQCGPMASQHRVRLMPILADADPPLIISGDAELLRVMLDNLVRNAIRFSPSQEQVTITVAGAGDECLIAVRDFGRGVPESLMPSLFDRFTQRPEEANTGRGHGLGLSIAQGVAELHAGKISVRNLPDGGCEFVARLPLAARSAKVGPETRRIPVG